MDVSIAMLAIAVSAAGAAFQSAVTPRRCPLVLVSSGYL